MGRITAALAVRAILGELLWSRAVRCRDLSVSNDKSTQLSLCLRGFDGLCRA